LKDSFTPNLEDAVERHDEETLDQIAKAKTFLQTYHNLESLQNPETSPVPGGVVKGPGATLVEEQPEQAGVGPSDLSLEVQPASSSSNAAF
jgi:hypothetical protein